MKTKLWMAGLFLFAIALLLLSGASLAGAESEVKESERVIRDATLDGERVYLLRETGNEDELEFVAVENDVEKLIISSQDLDKWTNVLYQTKKDLLLASKEGSEVKNIYIVDKSTLKYEKVSTKDFLAPFINLISEQGYVVDEKTAKITEEAILFNQSGVVWVFLRSGEKNC
ncbi:hypothetical protein A6P54_12645 [Bacillus sp. MKU004]|nr:hypothetical protein A6P54_12645 [Bacillus sp. MKU004]